MITLRSLAWQFIDDFSGGGKTVDSKLDERDVILKIRQIINEILPLQLYKNYAEGDVSGPAMYIATYELTLLNDADRNLAYITLPEFHTSLPYNRGIHRIYLKDDPYRDIVISHQPGIGANLKAGNVAGINYGFQEGLKFILRNVSVEPDEEPKKVIYQPIIAAPDTIGINDPLPIIPEQQGEILKRLMIIYRPVPQDLTPNGNKDN